MVNVISQAIPAPDLPDAPVTPLDPVPAHPTGNTAQATPTLASLHIGQVINQRYQLQHRLAIGGMGEVWKVTDQKQQKELALKILRPELAGQKIFLSRLKIEAENASKLHHPNLAQVFDSGEENGLGWIAMELVEGVSLTQILEQEPVLNVDFLLSVLDQTSRALVTVHQANIVHRDIKPGNIMVTAEGIVKLTDFGISKASDQVTLTAAGMVMGTAQYLPPEQAIGKAATPAGDLYSLGIIAYEALAGHRPFTGERPVDIAFAHVKEPVPALPTKIPDELKHLVYKLLEKDPLKRPESAAQLVKLLTDLRLKEAQGLLPPGTETAAPGTINQTETTDQAMPHDQKENTDQVGASDKGTVEREASMTSAEASTTGEIRVQSKSGASASTESIGDTASAATLQSRRSESDAPAPQEEKSQAAAELGFEELLSASSSTKRWLDETGLRFPHLKEETVETGGQGPTATPINTRALEADGSPIRFLSGGTVPAPEVMPPTITVDHEILHQRQLGRRSFDQITYGKHAVSQVSADYTGAWPTRRSHHRRNNSLDQALSRFTKQWLRANKSTVKREASRSEAPATDNLNAHLVTDLPAGQPTASHSTVFPTGSSDTHLVAETAGDAATPKARHSRNSSGNRSGAAPHNVEESGRGEQTGLLPAISIFPKRRELRSILGKAKSSPPPKVKPNKHVNDNRQPAAQPPAQTGNSGAQVKPRWTPTQVPPERTRRSQRPKNSFLERWLGNNRK